MAFGSRLKAILDERNMTPTDLEKISGIKRRRIYSWISRDTAKIDPEVYTAIASALEIDVSLLLDPRTMSPIRALDDRISDMIVRTPDVKIILDLTPEELTRVIDFASGLIANRPNKR